MTLAARRAPLLCPISHAEHRGPNRIHVRRPAARLSVAAAAAAGGSSGSPPPVALQLAGGTQVAMPTSKMVLGSAADADLQLEGSGVAAQHAKLGAVACLARQRAMVGVQHARSISLPGQLHVT